MSIGMDHELMDELFTIIQEKIDKLVKRHAKSPNKEQPTSEELKEFITKLFDEDKDVTIKVAANATLLRGKFAFDVVIGQDHLILDYSLTTAHHYYPGSYTIPYNDIDLMYNKYAIEVYKEANPS